ncbi:uncharacterized protein LOC124265345 [Haliotis rubra]|uniref:uncharacterized protein LOC124265345 n=1 Tax=Haliotis rubra TaxID=36100 RepID=UPI001EE5DE5A|nr:uncharacterized protein LOC124265345 [Haliotis rubra]
MSRMPSKQRYCCICSNHCKKFANGRKITMHRFPADIRLRRVWIQRCKLVRSNFKYTRNDSTRLCSEHFYGGEGPSKLHPLPTVFPKKTFKLSNVSHLVHGTTCETDLDHGLGENMDIDDVNEIALHMEDTSMCDVSAEKSDSPAGLLSRLERSLSHHDYCGSQMLTSLSVNKCTQTFSEPVTSAGTQTFDNEIIYCNASTQTYDSLMHSVGIQVDKPTLTYEDIRCSDESVMFYTGVPDSSTFEALFDEMYDDEQVYSDTSDGGRPHALRQIDEFFMILMRLRLGLLLDDLAYRFRISRATCGRLCNKWFDYLYVQLSFLVQWPSRENVNATMPDSFSTNYPTTRVVVDCTEIWTETPSSLQLQSLLYSDYKSHMTYKALIGISPAGVVTFSSDLYCGSISDKQITKLSGLVELCEEGDAIMADKGFLISDFTTPRGIDLIIPPI